MFGKAPKAKPPKSYPDMTLTLEKGAVRMFRETLKVTRPAKVITSYVRTKLLHALCDSIKQSELACGKKCAYGMDDLTGFDQLAQDFTIELTDIEQFALRHLLINISGYDIVRSVPNRGLLGDVLLALDKNVIMHGGYDHSISPENLALLHTKSKRINAFLDVHANVRFTDLGEEPRWRKMFTLFGFKFTMQAR